MIFDKFYLCYANIIDLLVWLRENNLEEKNFVQEKSQWKKEISGEPNFFSDTELLIAYQDILLLKVPNNNQLSFLVKTYKLDYQIICQKVFPEKKNIIIVSDQQWKERNNLIFNNAKFITSLPQEISRAIILFKDQENIKKSLKNWLEKVNS